MTERDYRFLDIARGCGDHIYQHDACPHCTNNSAVVDTVIRCLRAEDRARPASPTVGSAGSAGAERDPQGVSGTKG